MEKSLKPHDLFLAKWITTLCPPVKSLLQFDQNSLFSLGSWCYPRKPHNIFFNFSVKSLIYVFSASIIFFYILILYGSSFFRFPGDPFWLHSLVYAKDFRTGMGHQLVWYGTSSVPCRYIVHKGVLVKPAHQFFFVLCFSNFFWLGYVMII